VEHRLHGGGEGYGGSDDDEDIITNNNGAGVGVGSRGIALRLPREVADALRRSGSGGGGGGRQSRRGAASVVSDEGEDEDDVIPVNRNNSNDNNGSSSSSSTSPVVVADPTSTTDDAEEEEDSVLGAHAASDFDFDDGDNISTTTPSSVVPVALIDWKKLAGYEPASDEEVRHLERQLHEALRGGGGGGSSNRTTNNEDVVDDEEEEERERDDALSLSRNFDAEMSKLFERGIARHSDTRQLIVPEEEEGEEGEGEEPAAAAGVRREEHRRRSRRRAVVVIEYPEYLYDSKTSRLASTARLWNRQLRDPPLPDDNNGDGDGDYGFVNRLFGHVRDCSRSLLWKDAMRTELEGLVRAELRLKRRRKLEREVFRWKTCQRQERLDKLYAVRETFEHKIGVARTRAGELESEREEIVQRELLRRRHRAAAVSSSAAAADGAGGLAAFDLESTLFSFPTHGVGAAKNLLGFAKEDDEEEEDEYALMSDYDVHDVEDDDDYDDSSDLGSVEDEQQQQQENPQQAITANETHVVEGTAAPSLAAADAAARKGRRRQQAARQRRQRLQVASQEAQHKARLEAARDEEERVRRACTTPELRMSIAVVQSLEKRLAEIDQLLETLQEEQWEDEEEGLVDVQEEGNEDEDTGKVEFSLLDEILAMVLGATPPPELPRSSSGKESAGDSQRQHALWLAKEHQSIVRDWKAYFGRLPPPLSSGKKNGDTGNEEKGKRQARDELFGPEQRRNNKPQSDEPVQAAALRDMYGIDNDNVLDNWEDDDEEPDAAGVDRSIARQKPQSTAKPQPAPKPKLVGLRPGGRVQK